MFKAIKEFFLGKSAQTPNVEAPYKVEAPQIPTEFTPPPKAAEIKVESVVPKAEEPTKVSAKVTAKTSAVKSSRPPVKKENVARKPAARKTVANNKKPE
jgi:hypothetical protein